MQIWATKGYFEANVYREDEMGLLDRSGDLPALISTSEYRWMVKGKFHRIGGPAIEYADGGFEWWVYNQIHREDGPAIYYPATGSLEAEIHFYLFGSLCSLESFIERSPYFISKTKGEKLAYYLKWK